VVGLAHSPVPGAGHTVPAMRDAPPSTPTRRTRTAAVLLASVVLACGVTACDDTTTITPSPGGGTSTGTTPPDGATPTGTTPTTSTGAGPGPTPSGGELRVAPDGDDAGDGSPEHPLRTLDGALRRAQDGTTIRLAAGDYPAAHPTDRHGTPVRVVGPDDGRATIAGVQASGAAGLSFERVAFSATVTLTNSPADLGRETSDVRFRDARFSTPDARTSCLAPRNGTNGLVVERSVFSGCFDGIETSGAPSRSGHPVRRVEVRGNRIEDMRSDGINFAFWQDAVIEGNTITRLQDPERTIHNDGIQIMGGSSRITIRDNVITDSLTQLLFVEPTIGGPVKDLTVENNLLVGAGAAAVQMIDTQHLRFVGNTIADSRYQGLMLRHAPKGPAPDPSAGAVVANNVLAAGYLREDPVPVRLQTGNLVGGQAPAQRGPGDVVRRVVDLVGRGAGMRLADGAPDGVGVDPSQWVARPKDGPTARTPGYVAPKGGDR
jgi:hypothetical protein